MLPFSSCLTFFEPDERNVRATEDGELDFGSPDAHKLEYYDGLIQGVPEVWYMLAVSYLLSGGFNRWSSQSSP
jgi:hypothetical protein